jgi:alpha-L-arabinofuranosidase
MSQYSFWNGTLRNRLRRPGRAIGRAVKLRPGLEPLEVRALLAVVTVDAAEQVRPVNTQLLGVNVASFDSDLNTTQTLQMVQAAGLNVFRIGGSGADVAHFNVDGSYTAPGTIATMAEFMASANGQGIVTVDYGSGSPQEAAALLAYLDAPVGNTTSIGMGEEWNTSSSTWQQVNWQNAGYWANIRASSPLAHDDGLNFLRIDHPAPFGIEYFEVGNEEYLLNYGGTGETDHHGQGGDTGKSHDPATYVKFAKQFASYAAQIDPSTLIGVDVGQPTGPSGDPYEYDNWTGDVLQQSAEQGFIPGFLSDHNYVQQPGSESDSTLLLDTVSDPDPTDPDNPYDWTVRAQDYENLIQQDLGSAGANVELIATEFNSVEYNPGKQSTSLVNGLYVADSLGSLLESPYEGADIWDLRNYYDTTQNNSASLYGWREGGDYGIIGSPGGPSPPTSGAYVPYPSYFGEQLASKIIQAGGNVVQAASNDPNLSVYAVLEPDGDLDLMVINKSSTSALTGQFQVAGFQPSTQAQVWQYGETQDNAQEASSNGQSALANFTATLTLNGSDFSYSFPEYTMTVLDLGKASGSGGTGPGGTGPVASAPTIVNPASAAPSPVTGTSTVLSVTASDQAGASTLTYTWVAMGTVPAPVNFSDDGDNTASSTTATFSKAGTYTFQVTVADPSGLTATSSVTVTVDPTLTSIAISPGSASVQAGGTAAFTAMAFDQFHDPMSTAPAFTWSVVAGGGTIGANTGLYTAPTSAGTATVRAESGGISATASVMIMVPPVTYADLSDTQKRFIGSITITDTGSQAIDGWTLQFEFPHKIARFSGAKIIKHHGPFYLLKNAKSDATIAPGQSVTLRFKGTPGNAFAGPTDIVLDGVPVDDAVASARTAISRVGRPRAATPTDKTA